MFRASASDYLVPSQTSRLTACKKALIGEDLVLLPSCEVGAISSAPIA